MPADFTPLSPGTHRRTIDMGGRERSYLLHVPPSYESGRPLSLVLAFHGGATDAAFMARFCGLNEKADQAGFAVVYPNGTGETSRLLTWNAGNCCGYARRHNIDDVGFVRAILDELLTTRSIDERRVYATGMSNGRHDELSTSGGNVRPDRGHRARRRHDDARRVSRRGNRSRSFTFMVPMMNMSPSMVDRARAACRRIISPRSTKRSAGGSKSMAAEQSQSLTTYRTSARMACRSCARSTPAAATDPRSCCTSSTGADTPGRGAIRASPGARPFNAQHFG